MSVRSQLPLRTLFQSAPVRTALVAVVPVALALGQLANSIINGFSLPVALAFAVTMIVFAVVATGHQAAQQRVRLLETKF